MSTPHPKSGSLRNGTRRSAPAWASRRAWTVFALAIFLIPGLRAQGEMKLKLNESGSHFVKLTFANQVWLRFNESNPGTLVLGEPRAQTLDIGLRRTRMQLFGQASDRMFFYMQFGMNNFNFLSGVGGNRKLQAFFHDALGEYNVFKGQNVLKLGGGLTICNGLSRFSQPSVSTIMTMDVPVFAQTTVDQTDEFSRKLSVYARGQVSKLDYRMALSDPFPVSSNGQAQPTLGNDATFTPMGHHLQGQALLAWNFFDLEPHTTPYMQGTYLGRRKVWNVELGGIYQPGATWNLDASGDTAMQAMQHWSVASYLDMPLTDSATGASVSAYAGYFHLDYGPGYIRNNGVMNPANGVDAQGSFNGAGNAFPMFGTGSVVYAQAGYKFRDNLLGQLGTLMPYVSTQYADYQKLDDPMVVVDAGMNWLMQGHSQKLSLNLQNRPVFEAGTNGELHARSRRNAVVLQYQTFL